ncbi:rod shape-determining protein [Tunturiibacter gelidoferens]|uniref:Molecular chaperone HscA n=1 Tax=Tunturiibacter lichenicola TaxID=2051959 RepID=A0A7Y9NR86_9BACT|nr:rod shape-determining protein [Edaphobacter lichenicola]NYF54064.1 molecular chaperone HscA [Edaphobacter lichenicola]
MNLETAQILLKGLLERLRADADAEKPQYGAVVAGTERQALDFLLQYLSGKPTAEEHPASAARETKPTVAQAQTSFDETSVQGVDIETTAKPTEVPYSINLRALSENKPNSHIVCIDFGTAKSKAFARRINGGGLGPEDLLEMGLGRLDGDMDNSPYTVASSVWVSDEGRMFAGSYAIKLSSDYGLDGKPRKRLDSVKQQLSHASHEHQLLEPLSAAFNPTSEALTFEDAICFFLAYLTDLIGSDLEVRHKLSRYTPRRFTVPAWSDEQREWATSTLRKFLKRAQILADTFHDRWSEGIPVAEVRNANLEAKKLENQLDHLLDGQIKDSPLGISEPIAAGSARLSTDRNMRNMVLVVDVGAGTTDFALFLVPQGPGGGKAFPLRMSEAVRSAGDRVDDILVQFILSKMDGHTDTETQARVAAQLRLRNLRTYKRRLFNEGIIEIDLVTDERVIVDREEFLDSKEVKAFGKTLEDRLASFLSAVHPSLGAATQDALILFTGGGAKLPFVADLAKKTWKIGDTAFRFRPPTKLIPDIIADFDDAFLAEYGQLAVAIGGTLPLIDEKKTLQGEWFGGAQPPGKLESFPTQGL